MRINCPGDTELALLSWCTFGPRTVHIRVQPIPAAVASIRGADGLVPHLIYKVGTMGVSFKRISGATNWNETTDTSFQVQMDAGTHTFQQPGSLYLTGGNAAAQIELTILEESTTVLKPRRRGDDPREDLIIAPPHEHTLTTLVPAAGSMSIPDYHTRVGAWVTRANVTLEGAAITLGSVAQPCIPGSLLVNPVGADLMVFTTWRG